MNKITNCIILALFVAGCAQKEMAVSTMGESSNAIAANDQKIARAYQEQWDVLSKDELAKAEDALKDAKKHTADNSSTDKISKDFSAFDDHYNRAQALADARAPKVSGLLRTRRMVIDKGTRNWPDENKAIGKLDNEFRDLSEKKIVDPKDFSELQNKYMDVGNRAYKKEVLGSARKQVEDAKNNKAKKYAPRSLNVAEIDLKNAENTMDSNVNNPEAFTPAVRKANRSAALLTAIVEEQKKVNYNLDEGAAQRLVEQSGQIERMNFDLAVTGAALVQTRDNLMQTEAQAKADAEAAQMKSAQTQAEIDRQNQMLIAAQGDKEAQDRKLRDQQAAAEVEKRFQAVLLSAQQSFSPSEAEVFRQGNKILIRLKTIGFATGKSEIPAQSKPILERVAKVAEQLDASQVVVEGHTDSTGTAAVNETISQKRAESVMSYLQTEGVAAGKIQAVGYGFQKPLSSNKTKTGRAQNRRVDVWISPNEMTETK